MVVVVVDVLPLVVPLNGVKEDSDAPILLLFIIQR